MIREPIVKCSRCRGEGIRVGPTGPMACGSCNGTGLRAVLPAKKCACGATYNTRTWEKLDLVGTMEDDVETIELRNCMCGSTLAVVVEAAAEVA
jgi:DnaJ-class molecular chaperone